MDMSYRIGLGFDVHQLNPDRRLILGGVNIPHDLGLEGHSDADVLTHAVMDSLLGALAMGDIGDHFPDANSKFQGADSLFLLRQVWAMIEKKGYVINNLDNVLIAQMVDIAQYENVELNNQHSLVCKK